MTPAILFLLARFDQSLRTGLFGLGVLIVTCAAAFAFEIAEGTTSVDLTDQLVYALGTAETPEAMATRFYAGTFTPELDVNTFEANHATERWAAVLLETPSPVSGRMMMAAPLASEVDLYLLRGDEMVHALQFSLFDPYRAEQHAGTRLMSETIALQPNTPTLALVHIKFGPFERFTMGLETLDNVLRQAQRDQLWQGAFYAFGLACLLVFVALFAALEDWISLLYALLFMTALMFLAFMDGWLFRLLYPNRPDWQQAVGFGTLFGLSAAGFALARHGFVTSAKPSATRTMTGAIALCVVGLAGALWSPGPFAAAFGTFMLAAMIAAVLWGTRLWEQHNVPAGALSTSLTLFATLGFITVLAAVTFGQTGQLPDVPTLGKLLYTVLLLSTLIKFTSQVVVIRRQHAEAQAAQMTALRREAQIAHDLAQSERKYTRARDLAETRRQHLARASHDLRQPLSSLRMTLDSMTAKLDPESKARLNDAFGYISALTTSYLEAAEQKGDQTDSGPDPQPRTAPYAVTRVLQTVQQMFEEEAAVKGIQLRVVPSRMTTDLPAMALMRILANLTSNALNATKTGGVILGVRRKGRGFRIMIYDTGPGMSPEALAEFRREGAKGEDSTGHGIGLAVCYSEARALGLTLDVKSVPGKGTAFALDIPPGTLRPEPSNEGSTP